VPVAPAPENTIAGAPRRRFGLELGAVAAGPRRDPSRNCNLFYINGLFNQPRSLSGFSRVRPARRFGRDRATAGFCVRLTRSGAVSSRSPGAGAATALGVFHIERSGSGRSSTTSC